MTHHVVCRRTSMAAARQGFLVFVQKLNIFFGYSLIFWDQRRKFVCFFKGRIEPLPDKSNPYLQTEKILKK